MAMGMPYSSQIRLGIKGSRMATTNWTTQCRKVLMNQRHLKCNLLEIDRHLKSRLKNGQTHNHWFYMSEKLDHTLEHKSSPLVMARKGHQLD